MPDHPPTIHQHTADANLAALSAELANGVPVDTRDPATDRTPLMLAVSAVKPDLALIQLLLQHGANVNAAASDPQAAELHEHAGDLANIIQDNPAWLSDMPEQVKQDLLEHMKRPAPSIHSAEYTVLSLALNSGHLEVIQTLLAAGADARYSRPQNYDALIDAMHHPDTAHDPHLLAILQLLIQHGAPLNTISEYSESALSVASRLGRFDAVQLLLHAGADPAPLEWTPLMRAVALGSLANVQTELQTHPDLAARDRWSRTPWLLAVEVGDLPKAQLLLAAGSDPHARGNCGKTPLMHPILHEHTAMLRWLLAQGHDPNQPDNFGATPLHEAAENGAIESARILLATGADIQTGRRKEPTLKLATNLEMVRLLVEYGADLNDINDDLRAVLTHLPHDGKIDVAAADFQAAKNRRFGQSNPEKMNLPFWSAMIKSGVNSYHARQHFDDNDFTDNPIWCFARYGKSINLLPDGRIIEIAGEHEDSYDPDFCIYNDVIVHHPGGNFDIYTYPKSIFPPTDFHSATLIGNFIYIIGNLGYLADRIPHQTPVHRLNLSTYQIEPLPTSGENPGWIHSHQAGAAGDHKIQITGGKIHLLENAKPRLHDNTSGYILNLNTLQWQKTS